MNPTITITFSDGTEAVWFVTDEMADAADRSLTTLFGKPDSIAL